MSNIPHPAKRLRSPRTIRFCRVSDVCLLSITRGTRVTRRRAGLSLGLNLSHAHLLVRERHCETIRQGAHLMGVAFHLARGISDAVPNRAIHAITCTQNDCRK